MKRLIPLLIASIGGFALIVAYFLPATEEWGVELAVWFDILAGIAFILGGGNLLKVHLQKVHDRKAGWGYSGIILVSFLATLFFGLWKLGAPPKGNTEFFGESFAQLSPSSLPEYAVPRPATVTEEPRKIPASVGRQLAITATEVRFRGWPTPVQLDDLDGMQPDLAWKCAIEQLAEAATPPESLQGKVSYQVDHRALSFRGYMTADDEAALRTLLPAPEAKGAIDQLSLTARQPTTVPAGPIPPAWKIPATASEFVKYDAGSLTVLGPVTPKLRSDLAETWSAWPRMRPHNAEQRQRFRSRLEQEGQALSSDQVAAFDKAFDALWTPAQLHAALDIAGAPAPVTKSNCDCYAEQKQGVVAIERQVKPTTPAVTLNAAQVAVLERMAFDETATIEQLTASLKGAGEFTKAQEAALAKFVMGAPTTAKFDRDLYFELRKAGRLTDAQRDFLLKEFRDRLQWEQDVEKLFAAAHRTKYRWSGEYDEEGTPFSWVYLYVLQPLMTSTFAMLAFYVASAAFRAFRAKNLEATLLLITAFIVLLRSTPIGNALSSLLPEQLAFLKLDAMTAFIMKVPNTAGNRAIMIGIALGIAATSLKVLLGLDRSYLGSDE